MPWDRSLHARLLDRLRDEGARVVAFDIVFSDSLTNAPEADAMFAQAIRRHGKVVLAASLSATQHSAALGQKLDLPLDTFRDAAAAFGVVQLLPDPGFFIRRQFPGTEQVPSLAAAIARVAGAAPAVDDPRRQPQRWFHHYGPPGVIPSVSYHQALRPDGTPPGFFRDKIVLVGRRTSADFAGAEKEDFSTPYSLWTGKFATGVELHAVAAVNLLRNDWLRRLGKAAEVGLLLILGAFIGYFLPQLPVLAGAGAAAAAAIVVALGAHLLVWKQLVWFGWLIPVSAQIPAALAWTLIYGSIRAYVDKRILMQSLSLYVSIPRVKQLLHRPQLLQPGAEEQQISILFSDIQNFSTITERMLPKDLVRLLNDYFDVSIRCIHMPDGTVMKLIGDAVFAIWNAPEPQADHQERACRAALLLRQNLLQFDATHKGRLPLRTRVGLHTGLAYVGNFGSAQRFDYTAIGDSINLASRLEGLNKFLGTEILASRDILAGIDEKFVTRPVGFFKLKGFDRVVEAFELIALAAEAGSTRPWREAFELGLHQFQRREFDAAEAAFAQTLQLRPGDGPSLFYRSMVETFRVKPPSLAWSGEIDMKEK
jgi:adenylate cyclase